MRQKSVFTIVLILLFLHQVSANPVDSVIAKQIAQTFIQSKSNANTELVDVSKQAGYSNLYIFTSTDSAGFVIMSADDKVQPILGYSERNPLDVSNMPPNLRDWLMGYEGQIQYAKDKKIEPSGDVISAWNTLIEYGVIAPKSTKAVSALMTTKWNQSPYYNLYCPANSYTGEKTVTGCVATAMAQVMKYWNHPSHGRGFNSYNSNFGPLSAVFGWEQYDWNNMPNQLTSSSSQTQKQAVATLMYHCGVSVEMNYGFATDGGSNALPPAIAPALIDYFRYDSGAQLVQKSNYTENAWITLLKTELNAGRPIFYAGYGEGGHAFVCDGYNNSNYFHFNWGWGGYCDGYYSISDLTPGTGGTGAGNGSYNNNQLAVVGIKPSTEAVPDLCMYSNLTVSEEVAYGNDITGSIQVLNQGNTPFTGYLAVVIINPLDMVLDVQTFSVSGLQHSYYATGNISFDGGAPFVPGVYYALAMYSSDGNTWDFLPYGTNEEWPFATINVYTNGQIKANSDFSNTVFVQGETATVNVDVLNSGSSTFTGKIRLRLTNIEDGSHVQNIQIIELSNGLQPNYHYTNGLNFTGTITAEPGTYLMQLGYQLAGETSWYMVGAGENYSNPVFATVVAPPTLTASPTALSFQQSGGTRTVAVTSNVNWTATSSASWLTISPNSGTESSSMVVTATANNTNSARSATITLTGSNGVSPRTITVTQAGITQYTITVNSANNTMGTVSGGGTYPYRSAVTIMASPNNGYRFSHWQDNDTQNPRTIVVTGSATYTAYFEPTQGIEYISGDDIRVYVEDGRILVDGAEDEVIRVFDVIGRIVHNDALPAGIYMIKIGNRPVRKVVVK